MSPTLKIKKGQALASSRGPAKETQVIEKDKQKESSAVEGRKHSDARASRSLPPPRSKFEDCADILTKKRASSLTVQPKPKREKLSEPLPSPNLQDDVCSKAEASSKDEEPASVELSTERSKAVQCADSPLEIIAEGKNFDESLYCWRRPLAAMS